LLAYDGSKSTWGTCDEAILFSAWCGGDIISVGLTPWLGQSNAFTLQWRVKAVRFQVLVNEQFRTLSTIADFHCLVTRYGADQALNDNVASTEKDKIDGQRQLRSIKVELKLENGLLFLSFDLPVHVYLGTQFKLYATAKDGHDVREIETEITKMSDSTVLNEKGRCPKNFVIQPDLDPTHPAKLMCVDRGGTQFQRVFFLIDKYYSTLTAEGAISNNFAGAAGL